jgi:hypothetical protein
MLEQNKAEVAAEMAAEAKARPTPHALTPLATLTVARLLAAKHRPTMHHGSVRLNPPAAEYVQAALVYLVAAALYEAVPEARWEVVRNAYVEPTVGSEEIEAKTRAAIAAWATASREMAQVKP